MAIAASPRQLLNIFDCGIPSPGTLTATPNRLILLRSRPQLIGSINKLTKYPYLSQAFAGVAVNAPGEGIVFWAN